MGTSANPYKQVINVGGADRLGHNVVQKHLPGPPSMPTRGGAFEAGGVTANLQMVNQPNAPIASAAGSGLAMPMNAPNLGLKSDNAGAGFPAQQGSMLQVSNMGPDGYPDGTPYRDPRPARPEMNFGADFPAPKQQAPNSSLPVATASALPSYAGARIPAYPANYTGARIPAQPADVQKSQFASAASPMPLVPEPGGGPLVPMPQLPPLGGGKGGGAVGQPMPRPTQGQFAPLAPQGGFNVNQAAAGGLQQAMMGTQAGMGVQAPAVQASGYRPATGAAATYAPSTMTSSGYTTANAASAGYNAERAAATGFNAAQAGARGYGAAGIKGVSPITAQQVNAGQIAGTDLSAYTNPYESQVVGQALGDIERSRQMTQNQLGAQATAAKAFGGSRQGIAEAETNRAFAEQAAKTATGLRQAGFQQAQQLAGQDIATSMQAQLANQQTGLQAGTTTAQLGQQAQLANQAAANQASQFGAQASNVAALQNAANLQAASQFGAQAANVAALQNAAAANQASQFGAQAQNVASLQNVAAQNQAAQFGASAANQAAAQNMAAINAAGQFGAGAQNTMTGQNLAAMNAASQFGAQNQMTAQQINAANALAANQQRLGAASQLGGLANQAFQTGQTIQQQQAQQGLLQQGLQQALIDAAKGQYAGYTGAPQASLGAPLAALGAMPNQSTTTTSQQPGLFNYLQLVAGLPGVSDARLKTNITPKGEKGGVKFYTWDWNEAGKKVADPAQPTFGVIADELQETHPHLVVRGDDGYLRVNYAGLASELENAA